MALQEITESRYKKVRRLYFAWKDLNAGIKEDYTRGINLPEAITEPICCYVNGFLLSTGEGSEDAVIPKTGELVQIKASSNFDRDLTSFGPKSSFKYLHFVRLNQEEDKMYLYDIPTKELKNLMVNSDTTFGEQQAKNRRPRFSIINMYIKKYDIKPYAVVDLDTGDIKNFN